MSPQCRGKCSVPSLNSSKQSGLASSETEHVARTRAKNQVALASGVARKLSDVVARGRNLQQRYVMLGSCLC